MFSRLSKGGFAAAAVGVLTLAAVVGCAGDTETTGSDDQASMSSQWADVPADADELLERLAQCMQSKGWNYWVEDGQGVGQNPPEQQDEVTRDREARMDEIGANDILAPEWTPEHMREVYDATAEFHDCLIDAGFSPPNLISYAEWEEMLLVEYQYYDLVSLTGITHAQLQETECVDPLSTW